MAGPLGTAEKDRDLKLSFCIELCILSHVCRASLVAGTSVAFDTIISVTDTKDSYSILSGEEMEMEEPVSAAAAAEPADDSGPPAEELPDGTDGDLDLCGNQISGARRHRRDVVSITASAR